MPNTRPILVACLAALVAACDATDPVTPSVGASLDSVAEPELAAAAVEFFIGFVTGIFVRGINGHGRLLEEVVDIRRPPRHSDERRTGSA
jgi:hypothetical protein